MRRSSIARAIALVDVVMIPGLERIAEAAGGSSDRQRGLLGSRAATWGLESALVLYGCVADLSWLRSSDCPLRAIDAEQSLAFRSAAAAVAPGTGFVVVTGVAEWNRDFEAEWFPYLTGCTSATTVQGTEQLADL